MIFIKIRHKVDTMKSLDRNQMFSVFQKRRHRFLGDGEKLVDLKIHLVRNFRNKFRNMSLKYEVITDQEKKTIRAKINGCKDAPQREWQILNYLRKSGLGKRVPLPLDYFKPLNIFFYSEAPGVSFEELLSQKRINEHLKFVGLIAGCLNRIHRISKKPHFLPLKTIREEKEERRHWFFLIRKCAPDFYPAFSRLLKELWRFSPRRFLGRSKGKTSIVHGDFHWGNVVKVGENDFKIMDFGAAFLGDPLEDVGGFLAQNDSMFRYYAPSFIREGRRIREVFLKSYFVSPLSPLLKSRLLYFEIQKMLEMAAILGFIEPNEKNKAMGIKRLLIEAEQKLRELMSL